MQIKLTARKSWQTFKPRLNQLRRTSPKLNKNIKNCKRKKKPLLNLTENRS